MQIVNRSQVRDLMKVKPKGQRLNDAFAGNWDLLTNSELEEVYDVLQKEFEEILLKLNDIKKQRDI